MNTPISDWKQGLILSEVDKRQGYWMLDDTHFLKPLTPLFASFMLPAVTTATKRAFENMKMPLLQFVVKSEHGYYYQSMPLHPEPFEERRAQNRRIMEEEYYPRIKADLESKVNDFYMPFYNKLSERALERLSLDKARFYVEELRDFYVKAWQYHFEISLARSFLAVELEELYLQLTGSGKAGEVYDCLRGVMNMSLETDRGLWLLAEQVKASPVLRAVFEESDRQIERLGLTSEGREFIRELQDFLGIYGHRTSVTHEFSEETWLENPSIALSLLAGYLRKDYDFDKEFRQAAAERESRVKELFGSLPEGEQAERFKTLYGWALDSWGVDEDHHFYIDAMLAARSRIFLKHVGRCLVQHGVIEGEEDIFFLYLDELLEALEKPRIMKDTVEKNRLQHRANLGIRPQPSFGIPPELPPDPVLVRIFGWRVGRGEESRPASIRGWAASAGAYTGPVRIMNGQEDFGKLRRGEVIVCRTTTPPWTVLFPIAGALVTDAGGILSHGSIIAREYKLPAVVGTMTATSMLKNGDLVTVDGDQGVVYVQLADREEDT